MAINDAIHCFVRFAATGQSVLVAAVLAGCQGDPEQGPQGGSSFEGPYIVRPVVHTVALDSSLEDPDRPVIVGSVYNAERTGVRAEEGPPSARVPFAFVDDELIFLGTREEADTVAERLGGRVRHSLTDPIVAELGLVPFHVIGVDVDVVDPSSLADNLRSLEPERPVELRVGSERGLRLLAVLARELLLGVPVGLNTVMEGHMDFGSAAQTFRDDVSLESSEGLAPANAFDWDYMATGGPLRIDVRSAWWTMENRDMLGERIRVAFIDGGFDVSEDLRSPIVLSAFHGVGLAHDEVLGTPNAGSCTNGSPCPWHGFSVAHAGAALADNGRGAAGPGGPVIEPVLIFTDYTRAANMEAMILSLSAGARIINMSFGGTTPIGQWAGNEIYDAYTSAIRSFGRLLIASAGNTNQNNDEVACSEFSPGTWICYETGWTAPCENSGVLCVGGLADGATHKHASSSYGRFPLLGSLPPGVPESSVLRDPGTVDMFAPYRLWVPRAPEEAGSAVWRVPGTSGSAPFVAGVAALLWASRPSATVAEIEALLLETARVSASAEVPRYVHAGGHFLQTYCPEKPEIHVAAPAHLAEFPEGEPITFSVAGTAQEPVVVRWERTDAPFHGDVIAETPSFSTDALGIGVHGLRAIAFDACGQRDDAFLQVRVVERGPNLQDPSAGGNPAEPDPPVATIVRPLDGEEFGAFSMVAGVPPEAAVELSASAMDGAGEPLAAAQFGWVVTVREGAAPATYEREGATATVQLPGGAACNEVAVYTVELEVGAGQAQATDAVTVAVRHVCPQ